MRKLSVTLLIVFAVAMTAVAQMSKTAGDLHPTGKGWGEARSDVAGSANASGKAKPSRTGISYHGGPVMTNANGNSVYYIWYGDWSGNSAVNILTNFANSIGGTPYLNINTTYFDASAKPVVNKIALAGSRTDAYSQGNALSDSQIRQVVSSAIGSGKFPADPNAVYFVLTSADVNATSGFCTRYCGWHTHGTIGGQDIKYSFVGNPDRCINSCADQTTGPNGNAGADGMASIIAHELEEALTDPDLNAWYDSRGQENADKCAWTFGTTYTTSNGATANMNFGSADWLIQQNWVNAGSGGCRKSYP